MNSAHAISLYQSPIQSSQIPARAESPHSLPSPPLIMGEGDSSPAHSQTLATQLVLLIPPQVPVDGDSVDRLTRNQVVHCQRHIDGELA